MGQVNNERPKATIASMLQTTQPRGKTRSEKRRNSEAVRRQTVEYYFPTPERRVMIDWPAFSGLLSNGGHLLLCLPTLVPMQCSRNGVVAFHSFKFVGMETTNELVLTNRDLGRSFTDLWYPIRTRKRLT